MQTLFTIGETKAMVVAAVAVLSSLAVCWTWRSIRDKWRRLGAFGKFAAIAVFCALVWRGGAKNEGGDRGVDSPAEGAEAQRETSPSRDANAGTNALLAVTSIEVNHTNRSVTVGLEWDPDVFDNLYFYDILGIMSTNLLVDPTEDVLKNPDEIKIFGVTVGEDFGGAWSKQELFKGCVLWNGVNLATFSDVRIEGGWGINGEYVAAPSAYIPLVGFNPSYFSGYNRCDMITNSLFTSFSDSRMHSTNALNFADFQLQSRMLGSAIPAESFAAGANPVDGLYDNYSMSQNLPNGMPRRRFFSNEIEWRHSDLAKVAFYYVYRLFYKIKNGE